MTTDELNTVVLRTGGELPAPLHDASWMSTDGRWSYVIATPWHNFHRTSASALQKAFTDRFEKGNYMAKYLTDWSPNPRVFAFTDSIWARNMPNISEILRPFWMTTLGKRKKKNRLKKVQKFERVTHKPLIIQLYFSSALERHCLETITAAQRFRAE